MEGGCGAVHALWTACREERKWDLDEHSSCRECVTAGASRKGFDAAMVVQAGISIGMCFCEDPVGRAGLSWPCRYSVHAGPVLDNRGFRRPATRPEATLSMMCDTLENYVGGPRGEVLLV